MKPSPALQNAIRHIEERWNEGRSLSAIAAEHDVDTGNLVRAFRQKHGRTPKHFINDQRERVVMRCIRKRNMTGYEIGALIGLDDLGFYRWFTRRFGMSMTTFRKSKHG